MTPSRLPLPRLSAISLLGALGVAIGAANIIALVSVTQSGRYQSMGVLRDAGSETVFVIPYVPQADSGMGDAAGASWLPGAYEARVRAVPEVDAVAAALMMPGHVGFGGDRAFVTIQGVNEDYIPVRGHGIARGRYFDAAELDGAARVCTLGADLPRELFGRDDPLGQEVVMRGERFTVVGVMVEKGLIGFENFDMRVFIPLATAQELYELDGVHTLLARTATGHTPEEARDAIEASLRDAAGLAPGQAADFSVSTVEELTAIIDHVTRVFKWLLYGIGSVALLVAGIGIMNVMLMQVIERTREIGIRRAVGARRRDIWRQFLAEAVAQALIGVLAGTALGIAGSLAFTRLVGWRLHLTLDVVAVAALFSLVVGIAFGVYPALQAARLKPIDCLRYE